jgi:hypothetical protein
MQKFFDSEPLETRALKHAIKELCDDREQLTGFVFDLITKLYFNKQKNAYFLDMSKEDFYFIEKFFNIYGLLDKEKIYIHSFETDDWELIY